MSTRRRVVTRWLLWSAAACLVGAAPVIPIGLECNGARPGAVMVVPLSPPYDPRPYPTFGFMFDGSDGHLYATTAGHVALGLAGGERTWESGVGMVASDADGRRVGEFVYAINTRADPRPGLPPGADVSLIRVDGTGDIGRTVCGFGGPTGIDDRVVSPPELVEHRWFGAAVPVGRIGQPLPHEGPGLLPARSGVSIGMPSEYEVTVSGPASFGDSGAPVLSSEGRAVGWLSGPPTSTGEVAAVGSFVVSRIAPTIERAEQVLGVRLTLATVGP